jgi:hypothetical protein
MTPREKRKKLDLIVSPSRSWDEQQDTPGRNVGYVDLTWDDSQARSIKRKKKWKRLHTGALVSILLSYAL